MPCVSQRCGLCAFELLKGDKIVAIGDDGQQSEEMPNGSFMDDEGGSTFERCVGDCSHEDGQATGCHIACAIACANYNPSTSLLALLKALAYQYRPSPLETTRRMQWFHQKLASTTLLPIHGSRLPQELRMQIARLYLQGHDLHRYALMCAYTLPWNASNGSSRIRLSAEIWAHFIDFEGVRYISSLSNSRDDDHAECVFTPDPDQPVDYVLTAENYFGVVQIIFGNSAQPQAAKRLEDIWWRVVQLCDRDQSVITRTDGVKLRAIELATEDTGPGLIRPLWSTPPPGPVRSVQLLPSPPPTQLSMLVCNEPGVIGYSAHWNMGIMSLHTHIAGEDVTFYNGHEGGVWVYFPLQEGEKISEIWNCTQPRQESTLIFKTTHSRVTIFGPQPQARSTTQLTLVDLPYQNRGSRLFFEHSPLGIRNLAFETPEPAPRSDALVLAQTLPHHPKAAFFESYFYSTASLKGVNEIVPCQRYVRGRPHITGLLLKFPKGQQSCVGQLRLDSLDNPLWVHGHQKLWLGFSTHDKRPFVSAVSLEEPEITSKLSWIDVQLNGTLDWWFSLRQCQVFSEGKSSPPPRL